MAKKENKQAAAAAAAPPAIRVAVIAFRGVSPFHLAIPGVVFGEAFGPSPAFEVFVCAAEPQPLRTSMGYELSGLRGLAQAAAADVIVVPSWRDVEERPPEPLLKLLRQAHARGADVIGLCLGAHVLAEAGLLAGKRATTHWEYAQRMAARYPEVELLPDVLYVEEPGLMTSAGTAAGIDACLQFVRQRLGSSKATELARRLVVAPHRSGGQAQFIHQPLPLTQGSSRLSQLLADVRASLHEPHTLDTLAAAACMSRRHFTRLFRTITGTTVHQWLLTERLQRAQNLLERTDQSIEAVAGLAGFGSAESLRLHFRRNFKTSPQQWRRAFQGELAAGAAPTALAR
ncbi:helix-turn-helix domain-containing protein [Kinneretia asaccharophila]|nr:helix-turn-helix domain-containing protein [Roseateles asaccharophilus]MDN3543109.1 helix-turn-helix domain-containing protein [Roseateles asaccharophilus]